jgi:hypothetical protein
MLSDEEIEAFRTGSFQLHCGEIRIEREWAERPVSLVGPGRIYQGPDGELRLTCYPTTVDSNLVFETFPIGEFIPKEAYACLETTDFQGRRWSTPHLLLDVKWTNAWSKGYVDCALPFVSGTREWTTKRSLGATVTAYPFRPLSLPTNAGSRTEIERAGRTYTNHAADATSFRAGEVRVTVLHNEPASIVHLDSPTLVSEHLLERVRETLQFVCATPFGWAATTGITDSAETAYLRGRLPSTSRPRIQPPLPTNLADAGANAEALFARYLSFVLESSAEGLHPLSAVWADVLRSSEVSLETQATVSCTAVDVILAIMANEQTLETRRDAAAHEELERWRARIVSMLQEEGCPEPLATRVRTHLVGLESRTRRDVLEALASDGAVDARLIIPWRRLRNKVVHGSPAIRGDVHELARGCYAVTTLLYQLSFHLIGYRGLFRDFASGWALKSYPLEGNARTAR